MAKHESSCKSKSSKIVETLVIGVIDPTENTKYGGIILPGLLSAELKVE